MQVVVGTTHRHPPDDPQSDVTVVAREHDVLHDHRHAAQRAFELSGVGRVIHRPERAQRTGSRLQRGPAQRQHVARVRPGRQRRVGRPKGARYHGAVACAAHRQRHRIGAAHPDRLHARLERRVAARRPVQVPVVRVDPLQVQIKRIGIGRRESPGDMRVAPEHDERHARQRGAENIQAGRLQSGEVPHGRRRQRQAPQRI